MKIVINDCFGGFGLSEKAIQLYADNKSIKLIKKQGEWGFYNCTEDGAYWSDRDIQRDDPELVAVVETLGEKSGDVFADLKIVDIPDDVDWQINEYDGREWVAEKHRTWS